MGQYTLLLCNGKPPAHGLVRRLAAGAALRVAADGGANIARRLGIRPDVIVGDLDSITPATRRFFSGRNRAPEFVHMTRQDNTDLEKALDVVLERNIRRVVLLGATGKRIDHTLGNLSVLWRYTHAVDITLAGDGWVALPIRKLKRIRANEGTTVSLLPFGVCSGITLKGLKYPLKNATMRVGEIGLSNVVVESPFTVLVNKGNMLVVIQTDVFSISVLR